jgi:hypothetical protein
MKNYLTAINWKSRPAKALAILFIGSAWGLLWVLNDLAFDQGFVGWLIFAIIGHPLYAFAELMWGEVMPQDSGERISRKAFSLKRIGYLLLFFLGLFAVASCVYFLAKSL